MDQALIPISTIQKFPALARSQCLLENTPVSILIVVQLQNLIHNSEKDDKDDIFSGYMLRKIIGIRNKICKKNCTANFRIIRIFREVDSHKPKKNVS